MGHAAKAREQERKARARLRVLHHYEQVTRNVSRTCRFFGISPTLFSRWRDRYRQTGLARPSGRASRPSLPPLHNPATDRRSDPADSPRAAVRSPQDQLLPAAIPQRLCVGPHDPSNPQASPGAARVPEALPPRAAATPGAARAGQSVQVDVKHLKLGGRHSYQFTAIDEATRYRVLRVYAHNSIRSATDFVDEQRRRFPAAIQRIQTDHGSEFGTDFTWHLRDRPRAPPHPARLPRKQREGRA
jgi:transposase-like protein